MLVAVGLSLTPTFLALLAVLTLLLAARLDLLQRLGLTLLLRGLGRLTVGICLAGHPVTDRPSVQKRRLRRLGQCAILLSRKSPVTLRYIAGFRLPLRVRSTLGHALLLCSLSFCCQFRFRKHGQPFRQPLAW